MCMTRYRKTLGNTDKYLNVYKSEASSTLPLLNETVSDQDTGNISQQDSKASDKVKVHKFRVQISSFQISKFQLSNLNV